ncbi:hypothetical protein [Bacillus sp. ok061]|uniref:hypothetical protein n=1 Tax=Bacillus sp. ok061 TaxID=1761766 RepID=UPI0021566831|nr:hypothetical protein [Bacillus sp. ok061]
MTAGFGTGIEVTVIWKETITEAPGAIDPTVKPVVRSAPRRGAPLTVTLLGTRVVPFGIGSVNKVLSAETLPVFIKVTV